MTQKQLASKSGLAQPTVCSIENGERDPQVSSLMAIASALGITVNDLIY